ncbi:MAG TPA: acyl-CoA dehydrogenase family protein [Burkholderiales bacterium]|nr:acyl-CoA dehydrogenase family protein [Burkholderiales bacterium]
MNAPEMKHHDFSSVGYDEAIDRARALIPFLRKHAAANEKATKLVPEVMDALHENGLLRYIQPKAWGGMELDFVAYFDVPEMLGRGDASTAWVVANLGSHHRGLTLWPKQAQDEIWGKSPDTLIASGIAFMQGAGRKVDGGIEISGKWGFSSGVDHSEWEQLACVVKDNEGDGKPVDWMMCQVPRAQFEIIDDWQTLGMRGTGSRTVTCKNVFVPEHRALSMHIANPAHEFPGLKIHTNSTFRVPTPSLGGHCIAGAMVGNATHMLEQTTDLVKQRSTSYTGAKMRDFQAVQLRVGMAGAKIDAVRVWLRNDCIEAHNIYRAGDKLDMETRLRYKRNAAMGVKLLGEAVDTLYEMLGANGIYDSSVMQRLYRDQHAAAGHISFSTDAQLGPWAQVALGGEFKSPTL